ncbi:MAG TPA: 3-phosphoglycerate dehydrogenase [Casimicrobiaceae bacterium]|nr:3-phosphoglycerate dehydrogenase [Casimicrobiaceae bacterium]
MDPVEPLTFDLLEWIGSDARPHAEVMDAWRTSCPRLPVWEEAHARGYIDRLHCVTGGEHIALSALGREALERQRKPSTATTSS